MTERVDIVVTGLDPARPRAEVIDAVARRLERSAGDIALLLEVAPAPLVRALTTQEADVLLEVLRALGVRVLLRNAAAPALAPAPVAAPSAIDPEIVLLPSKHDRDDDASRPREDDASEVPSTTPMPIV